MGAGAHVWAYGGSVAVTATAIGFTLATDTNVTTTWNGTISGSGSTRSIATSSWARVPAGGTYSDTRLCVQAAGALTGMTITTAGGTTTAPSPAPTPSPTTPHGRPACAAASP